jgi:hypothetical protein
MNCPICKLEMQEVEMSGQTLLRCKCGGIKQEVEVVSDPVFDRVNWGRLLLLGFDQLNNCPNCKSAKCLGTVFDKEISWKENNETKTADIEYIASCGECGFSLGNKVDFVKENWF